MWLYFAPASRRNACRIASKATSGIPQPESFALAWCRSRADGGLMRRVECRSTPGTIRRHRAATGLTRATARTRTGWQGAWVEPGPLAARVECVPHRVLPAKALTPLLGEGRARRLQAAAGPTPFRHLLVAGAAGGAGKGSPLRRLFTYSPWPV
jgi:hypothetical protein